ncbi:DUF418 domain-containing protein [Alteromonas gilva]|uniref:DUF418 domain-containing protein n=1 Tax=Alteromonas gilva TaxID=2987522 RepID=A0ABT5L0M8_9ALTE|nr:DUF418 domain-containing protein [Alteromonas gilva]MDC8829989.1 DUF418 domain-containing protein [Alteromonas gilva]
MSESSAAATTMTPMRYISLDALRGLALLGILMMNIIAFAYPESIYTNPFAMGELSFDNITQWMLSDVFFAEKFYTLFAGLFGAGIVLMAERQTDNPDAKKRHRRRMFWLLLIGLLHAYGVWWGDILVTYAIAGVLIYPCRFWSIRRLCVWGFALQVIYTLLMLLIYVAWGVMSVAEQQELASELAPPMALLQQEIAAYTGSWWQQAVFRVSTTFDFHINVLWIIQLRICGIMMLGIALLKSGILQGQRSVVFYKSNALTGILVGALVCGFGSGVLLVNGFIVPEAFTLYRQPNYWGALIMAWGYMCAINWLVKTTHTARWRCVMTNYLSAVGRLALTNYLLQTIICTAIFYGWGLGLFAQLDRVSLSAVVIIIWLFQLGVSKWWLAHFTMGPAERVWRNLTLRQWQSVLQRVNAGQPI